MTEPIDVLIVGGGMITHDQLLPSIYHLQRLGVVGTISISALNARPLKELAEAPDLVEAFPGQSFTPFPGFHRVDPDTRFPDLYKEAIASLKPDNVVVVAVPDPLHYLVILEALNRDQNVLCVKPLVQKYAEGQEIDRVAKARGLYVGVEYHKRFDRRALLAKKDYAAGRFGEFKIGEARLVESWSYRFSNFQNWFTKENSDPFTYVGCHYVDQVYFVTNLRPTQVSVRGLEGAFPNGNIGYLWSLGVVTFENGAILSIINGLGYPDDGAGSNDQGLTLFCEGGEKGSIIRHNDQFRGVAHCYITGTGPGGKHYNYINPDYLRLLPWQGKGLKPVGYGYDSIDANMSAIRHLKSFASFERNRPKRASASREFLDELSVTVLLDLRRGFLKEVDRRGIIATPANSYINELVTEAARLSIGAGGTSVDIKYDPTPHVLIQT